MFLLLQIQHCRRNTYVFSVKYCYAVETILCQILQHTWLLYKGHLEVIWSHVICSNCIIFRLNIKQLLAQHIPLLGYTSLPSPWELPNGFTEPFFKGVLIPPMDSHQCSFLTTGEARHPIEHNAVCSCFLSTNCR
jgi:hypothetical protein